MASWPLYLCGPFRTLATERDEKCGLGVELDLEAFNRGLLHVAANGQSGFDLFGVGRHFLDGSAIEERYTLDRFLANGHSCGVHGRVTTADDTHMPLSQFLTP